MSRLFAMLFVATLFVGCAPADKPAPDAAPSESTPAEEAAPAPTEDAAAPAEEAPAE